MWADASDQGGWGPPLRDCAGGAGFDRQPIHDELERLRFDLHQLVEQATARDRRRRTDGTKWTNGQMLWHMAFGYVIVWRLLLPVSACSAATRQVQLSVRHSA